MGAYHHLCFQGRRFCLWKMFWDLIQTQASGVPSGGVGLTKQLEMLCWAVVWAANTVALRWSAENSVGLCLQGELSLDRYLIQRFANSGIGAASEWSTKPIALRTVSSGGGTVADKHWCVQAASCKEVLLPLPALFDYDTILLIMLVSEQTVFAADFRPVL